MITRRRFSSAALAAPALALAPHVLAPQAFAEGFPARPIRLIVPYAAGGGTDALARVVAQAIAGKLGQSIVIETLRQATVASINEPLVRSRLDNEGAKPIGNTPAEFAAFVKTDSARWAEIARTGVIPLN